MCSCSNDSEYIELDFQRSINLENRDVRQINYIIVVFFMNRHLFYNSSRKDLTSTDLISFSLSLNQF